VHYPGDVITGMLAGSLLGAGFAYAHKLLRGKYIEPDEKEKSS